MTEPSLINRWGVLTGCGKILETFRHQNTAKQNIPNLRFSKREKLIIRELTDKEIKEFEKTKNGELL